MAYRNALQLAKMLGLDWLTLEGDSQQLNQILGNKKSCAMEMEVVIIDTRREVDQFRICDFHIFVERQMLLHTL